MIRVPSATAAGTQAQLSAPRSIKLKNEFSHVENGIKVTTVRVEVKDVTRGQKIELQARIVLRAIGSCAGCDGATSNPVFLTEIASFSGDGEIIFTYTHPKPPPKGWAFNYLDNITVKFI